jgi:hypothetical protein
MRYDRVCLIITGWPKQESEKPSYTVRQKFLWLTLMMVATLPGMAVDARAAIAAPPGMVGWWPGDGNANDMAGTNNGILMGGATATNAGFDGQAFTFDGTNAFVQIADAPELNPTNLTVECWVRFSSLQTPGNTANPGTAYLVFKQNSRDNTFEGYNLGKHRYAYDLFVWEVSSAAGVAIQLNSITAISTNVWYQVVGTRGSNYAELYVNGQLEGSTNVNFPQDYGNLPLYLGSSGESYYDRKLAGNLDEVTLYNRALTSNEIAALYVAGASGKYKQPTVVTQPQGQAQYWGGSATLWSAVAGFNPMSFTWKKNGLVLSNAAGSTLALTNLQLTDAGAYTLLITNPVGSTSTIPATLNVKVADTALSVGGPRGGRPKLSITGVSNHVYGVQWTPNLGKTAGWTGLTNLTLTNTTQSWMDSRTTNLPRGYYRVVPGPISVP